MFRAFSKPLSVFGDAGGDFELVLGLGDTVLLDERSCIITAGVRFTSPGKTNEKRGSPTGFLDGGERRTGPEGDGVGLGPPDGIGVEEPSRIKLGLEAVDTDFFLGAEPGGSGRISNKQTIAINNIDHTLN
jgi:hypothetical protein